MQKKHNIFIAALSVIVALVLSIYVGITIKSVNKSVTDTCFDKLVENSKQLSNELYRTTDMDRTILTAMATIISNNETTSEDKLCDVLNSFNNAASYVTYIEMLRPDNTMLDSDGTVRDVSNSLDFKEESKKGEYISGIIASTKDPDEKIVRNAVPVVKDGKTIYMLYGVIRLSEFAQAYTTSIYDGHAYVYVVDGDTGDFLLDTWHRSLGNLKDVSNRKMLPGYSFQQAIEDMKQGIGGDLGFVSQTTGEILYMHYEPVAVNNWSVVLTVEKQYALRESEDIRSALYRMAAVIAGIGVLYIVCILAYMLLEYRHVRRLGMQDQTTGLQNRNAYDVFVAERQEKTYPSICCIYLDANGLHEINNQYGHLAGDQMLRSVAEALRKMFPRERIFRIGGDEFIVFSQEKGLDTCNRNIQAVCSQLEQQGYSISYGLICRQNEVGLGRIIREADEAMLVNKDAYYATHDRRRRR